LLTVNEALPQAAIADLTDSSGGSANNAVAALTMPVPFTSGGAGTCAPKAGFDAELAKWRRNVGDLSLRTNLLAQRLNLAVPMLDWTAVAPTTNDTTIEAILAALTGTDGATNCVEQASALLALNSVRNNVATITYHVNQCALAYGAIPLTDSSGGTRITSGVLTAMADTATGVDGTSLSTLSDAAVDTFLAALRDAMADLAGKLNELTGTFETNEAIRPMTVVAAL
jgi:hypothetical protein